MNLIYLSYLLSLVLRRASVVSGLFNKKVCPDVQPMKNFNIKKVFF